MKILENMSGENIPINQTSTNSTRLRYAKTPAKVLFDEKKELEELLRIDVEQFTDWCIEKDEEIELLYKIDGTKIPIEDFARTLYNKNKELKFI